MLDLLSHIHLASHHVYHMALNLGNTTGGQADTTAMSGIDTKINTATDDAAMVVGPLGALGVTAGAIMHTAHFTSQQMKERGMEVVKGSAIGIGLAIAGPLLVGALTHL